MFAFQVAERSAHPGIFLKVTQVTFEGGGVSGEGFFFGAHGSGEFHDVSVGLELGKRRLQHPAGSLHAKLRDEVDSHVVGRAET